MTLKGRLQLIQDELDSIQCKVKLKIDKEGISIVAQSEADRLIAIKEVRKAGFVVASAR